MSKGFAVSSRKASKLQASFLSTAFYKGQGAQSLNLQSFLSILSMAMSKENGNWVPLSVRNRGGNSKAEYDALHDGVPKWLEPSLWCWVEVRVTNSDAYQQRRVSTVTLLDAARKLRRELPELTGDSGYYYSDLKQLRSWLQREDELYLDFIDYLLSSSIERLGRALDQMLAEGGSVWTVASVGNSYHLVRRVDQTTQDAGELVMSEQDVGAEHLRAAWEKTYGRHPDFSGGYALSVRAVEAAMQAVVEPKNAKATLGTMLGVLRNTPDKWLVAFKGDEAEKQVERVAEMCRLLWTGHHDRHGKSDPQATPVSQAEAEHALHIAVALVHLFRKGGMTKR